MDPINIQPIINHLSNTSKVISLPHAYAIDKSTTMRMIDLARTCIHAYDIMFIWINHDIVEHMDTEKLSAFAQEYGFTLAKCNRRWKLHRDHI